MRRHTKMSSERTFDLGRIIGVVEVVDLVRIRSISWVVVVWVSVNGCPLDVASSESLNNNKAMTALTALPPSNETRSYYQW